MRHQSKLPIIASANAINAVSADVTVKRGTGNGWLLTLATKAGLLVMPAQEQAATLGRIRAYLAARPETARGELLAGGKSDP